MRKKCPRTQISISSDFKQTKNSLNMWFIYAMQSENRRQAVHCWYGLKMPTSKHHLSPTLCLLCKFHSQAPKITSASLTLQTCSSQEKGRRINTKKSSNRCFILFFLSGDWAQGCAHARQALYHWDTPLALLRIFWILKVPNFKLNPNSFLSHYESVPLSIFSISVNIMIPPDD
jgi:hypothetical protein